MNQNNNMHSGMGDNETPENSGDDLSPEPEMSEEQLEEQAENPTPLGTGDTAELDAKIAELEAELSEAKDKMIRAVAEAENTRKRLLREREDVRKYAVADFARDLLEFSDNFRRALSSIPEEAANDPMVKNVMIGVETMEKELLKTMEKHNITKMEPLDEPFNPNFHEAMFEAPGTGKPAGTIIELIEPGYLLHDRLLRPARVGIAKDEGQGAASSDGPGGQVDTEA